jgi:ParB/RepB/Spo0J family partition protein
MNQLLESIREVGIRVPVTVYQDKERFYLLDGERRWRCACKLNLHEMPTIIQPKPSKLQNLLMMFNIHNVRVDWDLMPMALKLEVIRQMLKKEGEDASPTSLSAVTGVSLATVRRALDLLQLPENYQKALLEESAKPRDEQKFTADLFVEIYKSLHTVERHVPSVFELIEKQDYVENMVEKYLKGTVKNVVDYRNVGRIARADLAKIDKEDAKNIIVRLVKDKKYSIADAYKESVEMAYEQRELTSKINRITEQLKSISISKMSDEIEDALIKLHREVNRLLRQH